MINVYDQLAVGVIVVVVVVIYYLFVAESDALDKTLTCPVCC